MTINYFLFLVFAGNMQVAGPFHGLIACEKAATQAVIAVRETSGGRLAPGTACLSQKHYDFKYKEPGK